MRARVVGFVFVLGLVAVGVAAAGANLNWSTHASGGLEVPARDTNAQAQAIFHLSKDGTELRVQAHRIEHRERRAGAHPRRHARTSTGLSGVALPVRRSPASGGGRTDGVLAQGTITAADFIGPFAGSSVARLRRSWTAAARTSTSTRTTASIAVNTGPGDFPGRRGARRTSARAGGERSGASAAPARPRPLSRLPAWEAGTRSGSASGSGSGSPSRSPGSSARTSSGSVSAAIIGAVLGGAIGLLIGETPETIAGAVGGVLGALSAAAVVVGALRRGATRFGVGRLRGGARRARLPARARAARRLRARRGAPAPGCAHARTPGCPLRRASHAREVSSLVDAAEARARDGRARSSGAAGSPTSASSRRWSRVPRELFVPESASRITRTTTARCRSGTGRRSRSRSSSRRSARCSPSRATSASSMSAPARATRPRCSPSSQRRSSRSSGFRSWPRRARRRSREPATRTSRCESATARSACPSARPFDAIAVAAAAPTVPPALYAQLARAAASSLPRGSRWGQELVLVVRTPAGPVERASDPVPVRPARRR